MIDLKSRIDSCDWNVISNDLTLFTKIDMERPFFLFRLLVLDGSIASLTFGAERKFSFKHKKSNEVTSPRINLTFRQINSKILRKML
ncbi:MAG: hypothetical protein CME65_12730 [Halobacteriovoraceae bacterium]|nr:hypothetical protein [Halobacteriovoraceae bacterium]|tara:strand:+ start:3736 stop:3996 length:261 start_codon:yes stop_codon:yes gene_type:complete